MCSFVSEIKSPLRRACLINYKSGGDMIEVSSQALYTALKKALHISKTVHLSARAASLSIEAFDDVLIFSTEIDRISGDYMFNVSISDVSELKRVLRPHKGNSTIEFDGTSVVTITTGTTKTVMLGGGYDAGYYDSEDVNNFKHSAARILGGDFNRALEVTIPIARGSILDHIEMDVSTMNLFFRASDFLVDVRVSAPREGLEYTEVYAANLPVSAMSKVTKAINKNEVVCVNQITNGAVFVNDGCAFVVHSSMNTRIPNVHLGFEGTYFPVMISPFLLSSVIKSMSSKLARHLFQHSI